MNMRRFAIAGLLFGLALSTASSQTEEQLRRAAQGKSATQEELVSFKSDVPYSKAVQSLSELSKKLVGKIIVDRSPTKDRDRQIGLNIESMYWKDALGLILRNNQLWYAEYPEYFEVGTPEDLAGKTPAQAPTQGQPAGQPGAQPAAQQPGAQPAAQQPSYVPAPPKVDSGEVYARYREVTISSIFFEINKSKLNQSGLNFAIFRGKDLNLGIQFSGTSGVSNPIFSASANPTSNKLVVDVSAALQIMSSDQLGQVVARPQATVRSGSSASVQIGEDISYLTKDFSGNVTTTFYHTGTILNVSPRVFTVGDMEFVDLSVNIERSTPQITTTTTNISITKAASRLSLLNGEESYIGGLYSNEETTIRQGIPLLKDLPWWVFGLRYIFGFDSKSVTQKELIILMKAEFVPLIAERKSQRPGKDVIQERLNIDQKDLEKRKKNQ